MIGVSTPCSPIPTPPSVAEFSQVCRANFNIFFLVYSYKFSTRAHVPLHLQSCCTLKKYFYKKSLFFVLVLFFFIY